MMPRGVTSQDLERRTSQDLKSHMGPFPTYIRFSIYFPFTSHLLLHSHFTTSPFLIIFPHFFISVLPFLHSHFTTSPFLILSSHSSISVFPHTTFPLLHSSTASPPLPFPLPHSVSSSLSHATDRGSVPYKSGFILPLLIYDAQSAITAMWRNCRVA